MIFEEEALEHLEDFQKHYLGFINPLAFDSGFKNSLVALTAIVLKQQKEISELKDYVEDQKREARLASDDWN
jgi:hypothetical protein